MATVATNVIVSLVVINVNEYPICMLPISTKCILPVPKALSPDWLPTNMYGNCVSISGIVDAVAEPCNTGKLNPSVIPP